MMNFEALANLGGTVVTVIAFLYFNDKMIKGFNSTIQNHLHTSNEVINKNSNTMIKISTTMEKLCATLKKSEKGEKGERGLKGERGENGTLIV